LYRFDRAKRGKWGERLFFRLGLRNAIRNLDRIIVTFLVIAAAAFIAAIMLPAASGFLKEDSRFSSLRDELGGDVLLLPGKTTLDSLTLARTTVYSWNPYLEFDSSPARIISPGLPSSGVIAPNFALPTAIIPADIAARIAHIPHVLDVQGVESLPVIAAWADDENAPSANRRATLHPLTDSDNTSSQVGDMACLLNRAALIERGTPASVTLYVPRISGHWPNGIPRFDFGQTDEITLAVAGTYDVSCGTVSISPPSEDPRAKAITVPLLLAADSIRVNRRTFEYLMAGTGAQPDRPAGAAAVKLDNPFYAAETVEKIRAALPDFTALTVEEAYRLARVPRGQSGVPMPMSGLVILLMGTTAAVVAAISLVIYVRSRRHEMAVLKTLGAARGGIIIMVLAEVGAITLLGTGLGLAAGLFFVLPGLTHSGLSSAEIVRATAQTVLETLGLVALPAALAGIIPAAQAANASVMEVLRNA
jgi:hypothetical protein